MDVQFSGKALSKTVYTPVFNTPSTPQILKGYLGNLFKEHVVLAHPSLYEPLAEINEAEDSESKTRVDSLRKRVQEAYKYANGDIADGKWGLLVRLLRMPSIRGRARWLGSTIEAEKAVSSQGWINARSEGEWFEWERKWKEEQQLKKKVKSWQQRVNLVSIEHVDADLPSEESDGTKVNRSSKGKAKATGPTNAVTERSNVFEIESTSLSVNASASKAAAKLGFPVVKRSSLATMGKPKPTRDITKNSGLSNSQSSPIVHNNNVAEQRSDPPEISSSPIFRPPRRGIADISEESFLPPSFQDSKLQTSTPNKPGGRRKPSPIPEVPPSSPLSSPPNTRTYGRQRATPPSSSSLSQLPSTPTRNPTTTKRLRSRSPAGNHALKKARTMPPLTSSSGPLPPSTPPPAPAVEKGGAVITPKRPGQLPTLTELLASAKQAKIAKLASSKRIERMISGPPVPPPTDSRAGEARKEKERSQAREEQRLQDKGKERMDAGGISFPTTNSTWDALKEKLNTNLYEAASPAKSLSSLAASDSGSDDEDEDYMNIDMDLTHGEGFNPPLASTQAQGKSLMGYNSQFDVDGTVDAVIYAFGSDECLRHKVVCEN
ncbi:hypothetical protein L208DRAFT_1459984 [Tricholoma matsutake]|nr:hypothetical protein L208DRAFT_1459984 [Tricholoma matsutake 945]